MIGSLILRACVFFLAAAADPQHQIQSHLQQARQDLQNCSRYFQGQYAKAAPDLRSALEINPRLWKLEALLGMSEKRIGENLKAQADLAKAFPNLQEQKLRVQSGLELVEVDYALNDLDKAAEIVNVLRQLEPTDIDVLYTAHRIYSELSDETMLSLAMLAPDSARMHQAMAHELARQAEDDAAIANYREALKIDPHRADLHFELAEMLNTQSSAAAQAEAEKEYKAALASNPFDEKSMSRLGDIALRRSDLKTARLGVLYRELGRTDDSRRELAKFEKLKKMKNRLSQLYQEMRLQSGKPDEADSEIPQ